MDVLAAAQQHGNRIAVVSPQQASFSYATLLAAAAGLASRLQSGLRGTPICPSCARNRSVAGILALPPQSAVPGPETPLAPPSLMHRPPGSEYWVGDAALPSGPGSHHPARVAIMAGPGPEYVVAAWAVWLAGAIAVPLALPYPPPELAYVLADATVAAVIATPEYVGLLAPLAAQAKAPLLTLEVLVAPVAGAVAPALPDDARATLEPAAVTAARDRGALIIYTSGTTGRPKGVLHTHGSLAAQTKALVAAWEWAPGDVIHHVLPLHHIHGIVNAWLCAHAAGACVEFCAKFSPGAIWARLQAPDDGGRRPRVSVFMGVPTMYALLLRVHEGMPAADGARAAAAAAMLRLVVSGSSACPVPIMTRWAELTGNPLLERYGMTETGMVLSNPLRGRRLPGAVGLPLPGVLVRIAPPMPGAEPSGEDDSGGGELLVKGPAVFREYFGRPDASRDAFDADGYFKTGDVVTVDAQGYYRILGRSSVDIIKCGGYKLSALEIEGHLAGHPAVAECAVVAVPDIIYGEVPGLILVAKEGTLEPTLPELAAWAAEHMAPYKMPKKLIVLQSIPRNAMSKVNKKELAKLFK